jgi:hypothetical protein
MTTATMRNPVIPEPEGWNIVQGATHRMLSVTLDDAHVVYAYDTASIALSLVDRSERLYAGDLNKAIRTQTIPGRVVFRVPEIDCGGVLSEYFPPVVTGTAAEVSLVLQAIPHFYACLREPEERKTLRSAYRWLAKHAAGGEEK